MDYFKFHEIELYWLNGGETNMDGGGYFGVVPKPLWSKRYPVDELNRITTPTDPILIKFKDKHYLIDTSMGNKLTDKQKKIYGVIHEPQIEESLQKLNLNLNDVDYVLMTHFHFDHAGGLTKFVNNELVSSFPNATIYVNEIEWNEVQNPNRRSKNTYWKENWEVIKHQVQTFKGSIKLNDSIEMIHTGGHSQGHSIIRLTQKDEVLYHMADLMGTHVHQNPLWVMAYDDYPIDSIKMKELYLQKGYQENAYFSFYHDQCYRLIKWDIEGREIIYSLKRKEID